MQLSGPSNVDIVQHRDLGDQDIALTYLSQFISSLNYLHSPIHVNSCLFISSWLKWLIYITCSSGLNSLRRSEAPGPSKSGERTGTGPTGPTGPTGHSRNRPSAIPAGLRHTDMCTYIQYSIYIYTILPHEMECLYRPILVLKRHCTHRLIEGIDGEAWYILVQNAF